MNLLPTLKVLCSSHGVVVKESLRDGGVGGLDDAVVEGSEVLAVPVVGRGPQLQHRPHRLHVVGGDGSVHGGAAVLGAEVEDGPAVDQGHHHPGGSGPDPGYERQRSLCKRPLSKY